MLPVHWETWPVVTLPGPPVSCLSIARPARTSLTATVPGHQVDEIIRRSAEIGTVARQPYPRRIKVDNRRLPVRRTVSIGPFGWVVPGVGLDYRILYQGNPVAQSLYAEHPLVRSCYTVCVDQISPGKVLKPCLLGIPGVFVDAHPKVQGSAVVGQKNRRKRRIADDVRTSRRLIVGHIAERYSAKRKGDELVVCRVGHVNSPLAFTLCTHSPQAL